MILHVLPGDGTVGTFELANIDGDVAVCRECLVVGDLSGDSLPEFWENRARYLSHEYPENTSDYHESVVREFAKLTALQAGSEVNLWFEYELFCSANMWFCLSLLAESTAEVFRVNPITLSEARIWDGFGSLTPDDLKQCFAARVRMSRSDIELGGKLWSAFREGNNADLERLSQTESPAFPKLRDVCIAAIVKNSRPREIVGQIIRDGETAFDKIFVKFRERAGEYGYGDSQVRKVWEDLLV